MKTYFIVNQEHGIHQEFKAKNRADAIEIATHWIRNRTWDSENAYVNCLLEHKGRIVGDIPVKLLTQQTIDVGDAFAVKGAP